MNSFATCGLGGDSGISHRSLHGTCVAAAKIVCLYSGHTQVSNDGDGHSSSRNLQPFLFFLASLYFSAFPASPLHVTLTLH